MTTKTLFVSTKSLKRETFIYNQCMFSTSTAKETPTSGFCLRYEGDQIVGVDRLQGW